MASRPPKSDAPAKLDLKKQLKHLYQPSAKECALVQVPIT